jgi:hypothetical protein
MDLILERYPLDYRREVVTPFFATAATGTSICLAGLAGAGKSNLVTFLRAPAVVRSRLDESAAARTHICAMSCREACHAPGRFYAELLHSLRPVAAEMGYPLPAPATTGEYRTVRDTVRYLCINAGQQIVLVLDEFESLIQHQSLDLFEELRTIRDEVRTPSHFAYVFITHRLPHRIVGNQPFENSSLYRLIRNHIYLFGPYREPDAHNMLHTLLQRHKLAPDPLTQGRLLSASGCHAGLLAALVEAAKPDFTLSLRQLCARAATPGPVADACAHIWQHLHTSEREALLNIAAGVPPAPWLQEFLYKRGLLAARQSLEIFSPVFAAFVEHQGTP